MDEQEHRYSRSAAQPFTSQQHPAPFFLRGYNFRIPVLFFSRSPSSLPRLSMSLLLLVSPSLPPPASAAVHVSRTNLTRTLSSPLLSCLCPALAVTHSSQIHLPSFLPPSSFLRTARRCPMLRSCFLDLRALSPACSRVRLPALELVRQGNREGASLLCQEHALHSGIRIQLYQRP